jgi:hypothetical protein
MEFKKIFFRLNPLTCQLNKSNVSKPNISKFSKMILANQPLIIFDHKLNKVVGYENMSNDSIKSFDMIFNDIYKSNIQTKFHKFKQSNTINNQFNQLSSNQIDHIDIGSSNNKIKCYLLYSVFVESSIVIDKNLNIYHNIVNLNNIY